MRLALMRARQPLSGGRQVFTAGQGNLLPVFSGGSAEPNGRSALRLTLETMVRGGPGFDMPRTGIAQASEGMAVNQRPGPVRRGHVPVGVLPCKPGWLQRSQAVGPD